LACKPAATPLQQNVVLAFEESEHDKLLTNITEYQKIVGKLIYLSITRPDIQYSVHCLSQHMHAPLKSHFTAAMRVLRYLKGAPGTGIQFCMDSSFCLHAFSDAETFASANNVADVFTKGVGIAQHNEFWTKAAKLLTFLEPIYWKSAARVQAINHIRVADPDPGSYFVIIQFKKLLFSYNNFTCDDVLSWLYMVNKFFEMDHIDVDAQKIRLVSMHTFGKALNWNKHFMAKHGAIMTWDLYQTHVKKRFESVFEDPIVDLSDEYAISLFIGGLKEDIPYAVRMFKPTSLSDVFCLSKLQEASNSMTKGKHTSWTASSKSNVTHNVNKEGGNAFKTTNPNRPFRSGQLFSLEVVGEEMVMEENADLQLNGEGVDEPPLISLNALTGEIVIEL
ncbi:ribonuclease H-like domain-containing protein, partial [Tanacetum coccineum]